jgi:hypothetical protein
MLAAQQPALNRPAARGHVIPQHLWYITIMVEATIQAIFLIGYAAFEQSHSLQNHVRHAAWCIMNCRTAIMGGHKQSCPDGHLQLL